MNHWKTYIPLLQTNDLIALTRDAEARIGSHVAGGNPVKEYVEKQRTLLTLIQEELQKRL